MNPFAPPRRSPGVPASALAQAVRAYGSPAARRPSPSLLPRPAGAGAAAPAGLSPLAGALVGASRGQSDPISLVSSLLALRQQGGAPPTMTAAASSGAGPVPSGPVPSSGSASALITRLARQYGVDPAAARAVASVEGGLNYGAVGDSGSSFGPWQLHIGGALPRGKGAAWANSPAGIEYGVRQIAAIARGLHGQAAVDAIVRRFERPANPGAEVAKAWGRYGRV